MLKDRFSNCRHGISLGRQLLPQPFPPPQAFQNYICAMFGSQLHLRPAVMPRSFFHAQDQLHCSFDAPKAHRQVVDSITYSMRSGHFFFEVEVNWGLKVEWRNWKCFGIAKCDCLFVVGKYCMLIGRRNNILQLQNDIFSTQLPYRRPSRNSL
jgi:hypothetical protein